MKNLIFFFSFLITKIECKYAEGRLDTNENWAFLTRFCFLSEEGQFEYHFEFNEDHGDPNLLLYYDTDDQWPAVYKSNKNCIEKEEVLNIGQFQIVNLTARIPSYRESSGCNFQNFHHPTNRPKNINAPTLKPKTTVATTKKITITTATPKITTYSSTSFIIKSTTETLDSTTETSTTQFENFTEKNFDLEYEVMSTHKPTTVITNKKESLEHDTIKKHPIKRRSILNNSPPIKNLRIGRIVVCHNARRFRSSRERWWYMAISNCNATKGIHVKYKILMTNGPPGDYWHEHFSADEFYILPVLMAFSIAYSFLLLGIIMCSLELKQRQLLHSTYKIYCLSVMLQFFGILFQSIVYLKYAVSGFTSTRMKRFGSMLMGSSETTFLLLLLLLAKGYTITRGRLPISASIKLTIFMCLYTVTYISIYIYEANVFDPGEVLYLYESPAGYSLIVLRIFGWFMFIYSTVFTLKRYPEKGNFYYPFNIFGTLWFVAGPAFILSANSYIDKWVRESIVCAVLLFITFGGHLMFLLLTMPSVANKNFPYHVRTTQIGIMEMTGCTTGLGRGTMENFGHHVYEPTFSATREQTVIVPLTRRTEEIYEGMYSQSSFRKRTNLPSDLNVLPTEGLEFPIWSKATNLPALKNNVEVNSDNKPTTEATDDDDGSENNQYTDDYIKDVPIELFTVSKMVLTTHRRSVVEDHH
ncbi:unnamed protein product [Brassicogethes aeneus]|uniref:Intimal thickness related receptor IRP domain-containing protein n=1 Tax=Brassicogethes aeneus TaxID=1431903 RepID=A0A9P0FBQ8_BRAAE|nr:unnamed protein product [Brassicogethes aeneus]